MRRSRLNGAARRRSRASVAHDALRHRIILNFDAHAEGKTEDMVVQEILETLPDSE